MRIGSDRYERTECRSIRRNGTSAELLATVAGELDLATPKLGAGPFYPALLHFRRRIDKALWVEVCTARIDRVSTRKVEGLVRAVGNESGISKSRVPRISGEIDEVLAEFLHRRLDHNCFPYLFLDAIHLDIHQGGLIRRAHWRPSSNCSPATHQSPEATYHSGPPWSGPAEIE